MIKNILYYTTCIILSINTITGDVLKKNDVLNIDVQKYNDMKGFNNCPSYSMGIVNYNKCSFHFYCRGEKCSSNINGNQVEFSEINGKKETFITDFSNSALTEYEDYLPDEKCNSDTDCLTNRCVNNICISNKDSPVIECIDIEEYDKENSKYITKMNCGLAEMEKCSSDKDCASKFCDTTIGLCNNKISYKYTNFNEYISRKKKVIEETVTMKKNSILNINVEQYNSIFRFLTGNSRCPNYGDKYITLNKCSFDFFCRGEYCSSCRNKEYELIYFKYQNGRTESFIPKICEKDNISCQTLKCSSNSECLSNKCINNTCMINEDSPITECVDISEFNFYRMKFVGRMNCGKAFGEKCISNNECATNICSDEGYCINKLNEEYLYIEGFIECTMFIMIYLIISKIFQKIIHHRRSKKIKNSD